MRSFKYQPKGSLSPIDKVGIGLVSYGETIEVTDEQAVELRADPDFKEARAKAKADPQPEPAPEPESEPEPEPKPVAEPEPEPKAAKGGKGK